MRCVKFLALLHSAKKCLYKIGNRTLCALWDNLKWVILPYKTLKAIFVVPSIKSISKTQIKTESELCQDIFGIFERKRYTRLKISDVLIPPNAKLLFITNDASFCKGFFII